MRACKKMSVRCDEEFYQAATVALWQVKEQTRLVGKELRTRAYKRVNGSVVDEIRSRLGRRVRGTPYPHAVCFVPRSRQAVVGDVAGNLSKKEQVARILAGANPRLRKAMEVLLKGGTLRAASKSVDRTDGWLHHQLRRVRNKFTAWERGVIA